MRRRPKLNPRGEYCLLVDGMMLWCYGHGEEVWASSRANYTVKVQTQREGEWLIKTDSIRGMRVLCLPREKR